MGKDSKKNEIQNLNSKFKRLGFKSRGTFAQYTLQIYLLNTNTLHSQRTLQVKPQQLLQKNKR